MISHQYAQSSINELIDWLLATCGMGMIHPTEGGIMVLAGLVPSSQTVGTLYRAIHEQKKRSSSMTEANIAPVNLKPFPILMNLNEPKQIDIVDSDLKRCRL
jgi:hypothetical protein